ncbi:hypothetical protein ThrDRAFT_04660 [Frankia casuarinae]|jgi:aromatase|uniref:Actinorhodin polyketide synthase bifunctional cyclase/dehydratase n=1 Tax=Frankia casuarinae (strain DSM 45818 / CECT 9043 / HFP020203 / CcI3) TaxID=106370 RepID=Q2J5E3_FRACC|nr:MULTISPECIES: aromatase/cyclase [Frankia]ABD13499.1 actinorhodin polyketide synthase bifunctional cyclase/dehydratase [Frankia casuarinae]ESZ99784.1 hypothetical protein CcI6DRAFT_04801 [Frankia sp. CcI6]EYT89718.1 hypothetical protein ThrDRAFT_04660 [Frankia casuarinae]OAA18175.1 aromatase [Frankia casuarinae]OHV47799.1 hypothetical protein CgIS1_22125 [Frankia sp. CgIS1]
MTLAPFLRREHEIRVGAPAGFVYRLLAGLEHWPSIFAPFVHAERLGTDGELERVGMWTTSGTRVERWVAFRRCQQEDLRIWFRVEQPPPPLESMERAWTVVPVSDGECLLRLAHELRVTAGVSADIGAVVRQVDVVAEAETAAVRAAAERAVSAPDFLLTLHDDVRVDGPADRVYDFLYAVDRWPDRLPHVTRVDVQQDEPDVQLVEIDTAERRGGVLTTRTARVGRPPRGIVYKQLRLPPLASSHHVRWDIEDGGDHTVVRSIQTVVINGPGIAELLGASTSLEQARSFIRTELGSKVRLILDQAGQHVADAAG